MINLEQEVKGIIVETFKGLKTQYLHKIGTTTESLQYFIDYLKNGEDMYGNQCTEDNIEEIEGYIDSDIKEFRGYIKKLNDVNKVLDCLLEE